MLEFPRPYHGSTSKSTSSSKASNTDTQNLIQQIAKGHAKCLGAGVGTGPLLTIQAEHLGCVTVSSSTEVGTTSATGTQM